MSKMHSKSLCFFLDPYDDGMHEKIETGILSSEFTPKSSYGFRIHSRRAGMLDAGYIEKKEFVEKITDPFGITSEIQRITYQQIDFQIKSKPPQIIIFHPPKSYRRLLNQIAHFTDYDIAVENKFIDLITWAKTLYKSGLKGKITKLHIDKIIYDTSTTGILYLSSDNDLESKAKDFLGKKPHSIKKIKISFDDNAQIPSVELYSNGRISFSLPVHNEDFHKFYDIFFSLTTKEVPRQ